MSKLKQIVLIAALSVPLSGCEFFFHGPNIWHEVRRETVIDPVTGDVTRTFHWESDTGKQTTTTDVIRRGEDNENRRNVRPTPAEPPPD